MKVSSVIFLTFIFAASLAFPVAPAAETWYVDPGGGGDATTVAGGLALAGYGDTVLVAAGTYVENLIMVNGVVLLSEAGPEVTVLDGSSHDPVLWCQGIDSRSVIEGFTVTHGVGDSIGGGIVCLAGSSPHIRANILVDNMSRYGGAIGCAENSSPVVEENLIEYNVAWDEAGGIVGLNHTDLVVRNNVFRNNRSITKSGGALWFGVTPVTVVGNMILDNECAMSGGGLWLGRSEGADIPVEGNLFARNTAGIYGGGIYGDIVNPVIRNNTFDLNEASTGGAVWMGHYAFWFDHNIVSRSVNGGVRGGLPAPHLLDCNDFWQNQGGDYLDVPPGPGDLFLDPEYCDPDLDNYTLCASSPCLTGLGCGLMGAFGEGCGPTAAVRRTWGAVKLWHR